MNAEVVVEFFDACLAPAFEHRRTVLAERYSKSFQDEYGLILCDSFSGHHASNSGWDIQRCLAAKVSSSMLRRCDLSTL